MINIQKLIHISEQKEKKAGTKHVLCIKTVLFQPL